MDEKQAGASLVVQIVTLESGEVIQRCLESLAQQTSRDFEVVVFDNGSSDKTPELVQSWADRGEFSIRFVRSDDNLGFCGGHNRALKMASAAWVLLLNPDARLEKNFIDAVANLVGALDPDIGTLAPRILRDDGTIDSTGLFLDRFRRVFDRGQGLCAKGRYLADEDIFGCTGAVVLHRRAMLEDIAIDGESLDEEIFAYYDDLDVAWRSQLQGWRCRYVADLVAFHDRMGRNAVRRSVQAKSERWHQRLAIRNRILVLLRCEQWPDAVRALPWLVPYEIARLFYVALRVPGGLGAYWDVVRSLRRSLRIRAEIRRRSDPEALRRRAFFPYAEDERS